MVDEQVALKQKRKKKKRKKKKNGRQQVQIERSALPGDMMHSLLATPYRMQLLQAKAKASSSSSASSVEGLQRMMYTAEVKQRQRSMEGSTLFRPEKTRLEINSKGANLHSLATLARASHIVTHNQAASLVEDPCCICLEPLLVNQRASVLHCSHIFHLSCIRHWLQRADTCPMCKTSTSSSSSSSSSSSISSYRMRDTSAPLTARSSNRMRRSTLLPRSARVRRPQTQTQSEAKSLSLSLRVTKHTLAMC
jgi:hypothetical protein